MTPGEGTPCQWCGGGGWKFIRFRRSHDEIGLADERSPLRMRRSVCLGCGGTGSASLSDACASPA